MFCAFVTKIKISCFIKSNFVKDKILVFIFGFFFLSSCPLVHKEKTEVVNQAGSLSFTG